MANIYPAGGRTQAEQYGERLKYMLNMLVNNPCPIQENDGIAINGGAVDFRVITV